MNSKAKEFAYLAQEMGEKSNSSAHCCGMKKDAEGGGALDQVIDSFTAGLQHLHGKTDLRLFMDGR